MRSSFALGLGILGKLLVAVSLLVSVTGTASAAIIRPTYSSRVDAEIRPVGGRFRYDFTVVNTTLLAFQFQGVPVIMDWELPLFSLDDIDVSSITSPEGWTHQIVTPPFPPSFWNYDADTDPLLDPSQGGDPNLYGPNPQVFENPPYVIHWVTSDPERYGIRPGGSLPGFGFFSNYAPLNAPYLASWVDLPPRGGDPPIPGSEFGTPLSPARLGAQQLLIPEPATFLMTALFGPLAIIGFRRWLH